ncbi:MAG TPA: RHS repeat-associated core domain-containing protein [Longimicrobium sp.]
MRDNTGQMYMRNRYYDPASGRFTQEDPIGLAGGLNVYGFAAGDPANYADPFGLSCQDSRGRQIPCPPNVGELGLSVVITYPDGTIAIRTGGTRAWRNNNPGNLRSGSFARSQGAIGETHNGGNGDFAVFPDFETGERAQMTRITTGVYAGLSLDAMIAKYAPPSENNTPAYQAHVRNATGLSGDVTVDQLPPDQLRSVVKAMQSHEHFRAGKIRVYSCHGILGPCLGAN